jgi:hypothetical protein
VLITHAPNSRNTQYSLITNRAKSSAVRLLSAVKQTQKLIFVTMRKSCIRHFPKGRKTSVENQLLSIFGKYLLGVTKAKLGGIYV